MYSNYRLFSRFPKSFFKTKKSYDVVKLGKVSPKKIVPDHIPKPTYYRTGVDTVPSSIQILDADSVQQMRKSCSLAKTILKEVEKSIKHACDDSMRKMDICISGERQCRTFKSLNMPRLLFCNTIKVGVTTDELDTIAHNACISFGAYPSPLNYKGFPKSICTSVNNVACHGIPDNRKLKDGDIISVDISVFYKGFHGDCASTFFVGSTDDKAKKLVEVTALCLQEAINICHHEQYFCTIGKTISKLARNQGFSVVPAFTGHGIGSSFHCQPEILHFDNEERGQMLKGMIFTIEPVICEGRPDILILKDGWTAVTEDNSRSAQFEHTILITVDGAEILTVDTD
ncbi:methionine aminopeptidase 1D, mitochondrial [Caerostris extrusa]|uniref:Methionine aminopeptidase n=1 Tax=Caerostris extrusa TaxID=172846 RepID=A0AAV4WQ69_CAEEX|nr:methionine aminopeptidase 1D, mitochondrial [Caerostris extrusa]